MSDQPPPPRTPPPAVAQAIAVHGPDPTEWYLTSLRVQMLRASFVLFPAAVVVGSIIGAVFATSGWLRWPLCVLAVLTAWPALIGLLAVPQLIAAWRTVVLIYPDRLVVQKGDHSDEMRWDEVEAVFVRTVSVQDENETYYPLGSPTKVWVATEQPVARFNKEWIEVRAADGKTIRLTSAAWGYTDFSATIQGEVSGQLRPTLAAEHEAGRPQTFGPLVIEADGLQHDTNWVKWRDHLDTWVQKGGVYTADMEGEYVGTGLPTEQVPNLAVAIDLIFEASQRHAPTEEEIEARNRQNRRRRRRSDD